MTTSCASRSSAEPLGSFQAEDFDYELPSQLIAQHPLPERSASRLLLLDRSADACTDHRIGDLPNLLEARDLLVFNDTRVIPARLHARKPTGGQVEILIERLLDSHRALVMLRASKPPRAGSELQLELGTVQVGERQGRFWELHFPPTADLDQWLTDSGHVPLPPYIDRADGPQDRERYQTVYARKPGAVAAPTAGLHFDQALLDRLQARGIEQAFVTLHVGAGTFQPLRAADIRDHQMHPERVSVSAEVCERVARTRARGGRVVAVGTTSVRALESAAAKGSLQPFEGETQLYLYPGRRFAVVDALLTNFHLPRSSLLLLVCAFAGQQRVLDGYRHAVAQGYRFYSYGDAMLIL